MFNDLGMACALHRIVWRKLNSMDTQLDRKSQSVGRRNPISVRALSATEKHSLTLLLFFTISGLLYVTAAVFTTMLTYHALRDIFLGLTIVLFAGMVIGVTLFFLNYMSHQPGERR
jgi:hypothetical protein